MKATLLGALLALLLASHAQAASWHAGFEASAGAAAYCDPEEEECEEEEEEDPDAGIDPVALATYRALQAANKEADANLARSQAALDSTMQRMARQVAAQRAEQERQEELRQQREWERGRQRQLAMQAERERQIEADRQAEAARRAEAAEREADRQAQLAQREAERQQQLREQQRQAQQQSAAHARRTQQDAGLRQYHEAVTVCTKPAGPKQSFECRSPLNVQRGHAEDISGFRTPEDLARGEACPEMRRLASSTHLVWGCGFAATGANNALDRSAGVDIRGRRTYYCTERQYSCRRTEQ